MIYTVSVDVGVKADDEFAAREIVRGLLWASSDVIEIVNITVEESE